MTDKTITLAGALAAAQGEMKNAPMNKINPHFKSKYADLSAVRDATIPALTKHGLAITQTTDVDGDRIILTTTLHHDGTGDALQSRYPIALDTPQKMGSQLTYARRYCWSAICGIAADEDDDAEGAEKEAKQAKTAGAAIRRAAAPTPAPEQPDQPKQEWQGPLTKTQLTAWSRSICRDLPACTDKDQLMAVWNNPEHQAAMMQMKVDAPDFFAACQAEFDKMMKELTPPEEAYGLEAQAG